MRILYYIRGPYGDEKNILLFYMCMCHFAMGFTHCYKTAVFFTLVYRHTDEVRSSLSASRITAKPEPGRLTVVLCFCGYVK